MNEVIDRCTSTAADVLREVSSRSVADALTTDRGIQNVSDHFQDFLNSFLVHNLPTLLRLH